LTDSDGERATDSAAVPSAPGAVMSKRLWFYFLCGSVVAAAFASALPSESFLKPLLLIMVALASAGAFAFGIIRNRPDRALIWWLPLAGQLAGLLVILAWTDNLIGLDSLPGFGAVEEAAFLGAASLLVGFLVLTVRLRESISRRGSQVDALIVTVGLGSLWFEWLIWPYYDGHLLPGLLPSIDALVGLGLILAVVRLINTRGMPSPVRILLPLSVACELVAIAISHWDGGSGVAGADGVVQFAWLVSFALQAALALHPSMVTMTRATELHDDWEKRPQVRVVILTLAALVPVYAELIHDLRADGRASDETVIVGAAAVLFVLVALRINDLMVNINEHRRVVAELKLAEQQRVKSLEQIAASEEQYRLLVAGSFDCILILDSHGRVIDCNPAGEAMFGFSLAAIRGRDGAEILFPPNHRNADPLSSSMGQRVEMMGMRSDGTEFPIELTLSDLRRRQDRLLCVSIRDLTDRMKAEKAKRESDAKSRFLSTMSHELRTPLNSILGFAQLAEPLVASQNNARLPTYLKNIQVSGWHLLTLINDVLDFSGVQSGQLKLNPTTVVLSDLVTTAAAKMDPIAAAANVKLNFYVAPGLVIEVDPLRLEQVLLNLLTNAVKFTASKVWLRASRSRSGVSISVRDDGEGIAPEQQERVFEEFVQLQAGSTRGYDGAGLGLPISRSLVEAMGGTIQLESHSGGGATFTVWLPAIAPGPETSELRMAAPVGT
jgi:PAS domain S-box-containing protein